MSTPPSTSQEQSSTTVTRSSKARGVSRRQPLSCLPCRQHKLRCDRCLPCSSCVRYRRGTRCLADPAPASGQRRQPSSQQTVIPDRTPLVETENLLGECSSTEIIVSAPACNVDDFDLVAANILPALHVQQRYVGDVPDIHSSPTPTTPGPPDSSVDPLSPARRLIVDSQSNVWTLLNPLSQKSFWRAHLLEIMPSRSQGDILVSYYFEHINWVFQTVHAPTFRRQNAAFWDVEDQDRDLAWLSLIFAIISLSALYIPHDCIELVGISRNSIRKLAHLWHNASKQALQVGDAESKPCLTHLQTFSITQLYWYATNDMETLNSRLGMAIKNAHALNMDKDVSISKCLNDEMRHRIWWDLIDSDTFQSLCLGRPPMILAHLSDVPLPLNCKDLDMTEKAVRSRPPDQPTEMSMNIYRAKIFQVLNRHLCCNNSVQEFRDYEQVTALDAEIMEVVHQLPWYFQLNNSKPTTTTAGYEFISWQNHILRTCVSTQRIRLYRPFLRANTGDSWRVCAVAVEDALAVYKTLRTDRSPISWQKFFAQAYQIFSVAVTIAALLLVETSAPIAGARDYVELLALDLKALEAQGCDVPIAIHGRNVLLKILALYDQPDSQSPDDTENLVSDVAFIFGGEHATRAYLNRGTEQRSENAEACSIQGSHHLPNDLNMGSATSAPKDNQQPVSLLDSSMNELDALFGLEEGAGGLPSDLLRWDMTDFLWEGMHHRT